MKNYIKILEDSFDKKWLTKHVLNLYKIERTQTFPAYQKAAEYTFDLLKQEGFDAELINFPADGKTVYQDKCMPIGWNATNMQLTVLSEIPGLDNPVIADFKTEPLSVVKHSVCTPPEGIVAPLVTEAQMLAGEDVNGAFVLLNQAVRPRGEVIKTLLDLGAIGWVSDHLENPHTTPDSVSWINAGTEYNSWHIQADDRDFISFQITPRTGLLLRNACEHSQVIVKAFSDGYKYETNLPAVTALLPGEDKRELWVVSHMFEPLIDDNANGVIGSIAILKALRDFAKKGEIKLKYSIRLVFAAEMYGVAAVVEHFGGELSKITIGSINTDGITSSIDKSTHKMYSAKEAADIPGFAGNIILNYVSDQFKEIHPEMTVIEWDNYFGDDCFITDNTIGCPCIWIEYMLRSGYHHNSWLDESVFDINSTVEHLAYSGAWIRAMAAMTKDEVKKLLPYAISRANAVLAKEATSKVRQGCDNNSRMQFLYRREYNKISNLLLWGEPDDISAALNKLVIPDSEVDSIALDDVWYRYSENFVFGRATRGFPHDLVKLPKEKRKALPGSILYNPIANIISRMDGKKTLRTLIDETEWDTGNLFDDKTLRSYFHVFTMLADAGYFTMNIQNPLTSEALTDALRKLGVKNGDTLLVHSSLSGIGYIPGGANSVIKALRAAVGENGTFLAPAFTRPYISFEGRVNKSYGYRPYDIRPDGNLRDKNIYTGALPNTMLKEPDSFRSGHSTHEWVAIGADAADIVAGHGFLDAPTGETSPLKKVLKKQGSVIFIGCGINSNTFVHYAETIANAPYLQPAVINYINKSGNLNTELIQQHLPGHRSFYQAFDGDFYKEAIKRGLHIYRQPFGNATLFRMELPELYSITMDMFSENPLATLCSDPNCTYCRKFKK